VEAADESDPEESAAPSAQPVSGAPSRRAAVEGRVVAAQARARRLAERAQDERAHHVSVDVAFEMVDRDADAGGEIIAGALAYRIFIWLLPFALTVVLGLALVAGRTQGSIADLVSDAGITGFVATSVAEAADGTSGWALVTGLVVAVVVLLYQTSALLRAVRAVTALAWELPVTRVPSPTRPVFCSSRGS